MNLAHGEGGKKGEEMDPFLSNINRLPDANSTLTGDPIDALHRECPAAPFTN
jgi:hypothetical protein